MKTIIALVSMCLLSAAALAQEQPTTPQPLLPTISPRTFGCEAIWEKTPEIAEKECGDLGRYAAKPTPVPTQAEKTSKPPQASVGAQIDEQRMALQGKTMELLRSLSEEVSALQSQAVVEKSAGLATQTPKKARVMGATTVYNYRKNAVYEISASPDNVVDIQLRPGEDLKGPPQAGEPTLWHIGAMKSGKPGAETWHLTVRPEMTDIATNMIVATDERVYHLSLKSGDWHMPGVSWNYPEDYERQVRELAAKKEQTQPLSVSPDRLRFGYEIDGDKVSWRPLRVFDDGEKLYLQMPAEMKASEAPALFLVGEDEEPMLVNYRTRGDYYIVDRLGDEFELRVGANKKVTIKSQVASKSFFERLFD